MNYSWCFLLWHHLSLVYIKQSINSNLVSHLILTPCVRRIILDKPKVCPLFLWLRDICYVIYAMWYMLCDICYVIYVTWYIHVYATWCMLCDICYVMYATWCMLLDMYNYLFTVITVTVCALITAYNYISCINSLVQSCFLIRTTPVWALLAWNYQLRRYAADNRKATIETSLLTGNNYWY